MEIDVAGSDPSGPLPAAIETAAYRIVVEAMTNAVRHTESDQLALRVAIGKNAVLTEVADEGPSFDPDEVEEEAEADDTGWGLFLVQRLANSWGVKDERGSKRVWFELLRA